MQGVFFRASAQKISMALGVKGWVRNEENGSVTIFAEGDSQSVDKLVQWAHIGPDGASVRKVEVEEELVQGYTSFEIRRS